MEKSFNRLLPLLVVAASLSISLYEILSGLFLLYFLYVSVREKKKPGGMLLTPLILYSVPTLLSTALYSPAHLVRTIGKAIFPFLYAAKDRATPNERLFLTLDRLLVFIGVLLLPVVAYRFIMFNEIAALWGGPFGLALSYTFFSLAALSLFFFSRQKRYLFLFIVFVALIFFSTKRSPVIGFFFALALFAVVNRRFIDKRVFALVAAAVLVISFASAYVLVQKDTRFRTLYNVVTGREKVNSETLDEITSIRWTLFKRGVQVISNDFRTGRVVNILIGHGLRSAQNLQPKAPPGFTSYESIFVVSEFIEKGMIGLLGILLLCVRYFVFVGRFVVGSREDYLRLPFLLQPAALFAGMIFTGFWDALLPLYLLLFGLLEDERKPGQQAG